MWKTLHVFFRSISVRIAGVLGLALLPISLIALSQSIEVSRQFARQAEQSYIAWTTEASLGQQRLIQRASGAAEAVAAISDRLLQSPADCENYLGQFVRSQRELSFVGIVEASGVMTCSSTAARMDFSGTPEWDAASQNPSLRVTYNPDAPVSKTSVVLVNQPMFRAGEWTGYVTVSIPTSVLGLTIAGNGLDRPLDIMLVNADGVVLSSTLSDRDEQRALLPNGHDLRVLQASAPKNFKAKTDAGEEYYYSAVPIVRNVVTAISVWRRAPAAASGAAVPTMLIPLIMWAASLVVAFIAVDRLVLRPIRVLTREMSAFARNRTLSRLDSKNNRIGSSLEFEALQAAFHDMADNVLRDEADLENAVRQKSVLLKEVNHRVKNNLQMISSIMNMQIRQSKSPETSAALHRLQDRVLGLAAIYRNLHEIEDMGRINVGRLLRDLGNQLIASATIEGRKPVVTRDFEDIVLYPDQTVPLCLFFAEALSNALKYVDAPKGKNAELFLGIKTLDNGMVRLEVRNTSSDARRDEVSGSGMGEKLMQAFTTQLAGKIEIEEKDHHHSISITFKPQEFTPEARDY